jgi:hypothetical protein
MHEYVEVIDGNEVRKLVKPIRPDVLGASFCEEDAQINTPTVVQALAEGARREGAQIREGVLVREIAFSGERAVGVQTDAGRIDGDAVVVAAGAWSRELLRTAGIDLAIGGERLQVIATEPLPPQIGPLVYGPLAAKQYALFRDLPSWDIAHFSAAYEAEHGVEILQLLAQRASGEVLIGCPMDYPADIDMRPTLAGLTAGICHFGGIPFQVGTGRSKGLDRQVEQGQAVVHVFRGQLRPGRKSHPRCLHGRHSKVAGFGGRVFNGSGNRIACGHVGWQRDSNLAARGVEDDGANSALD